MGTRLSLEQLQTLIGAFVDDLEEIIPDMTEGAQDVIAEKVQEIVEDMYPDFDYNYN